MGVGLELSVEVDVALLRPFVVVSALRTADKSISQDFHRLPFEVKRFWSRRLVSRESSSSYTSGAVCEVLTMKNRRTSVQKASQSSG